MYKYFIEILTILLTNYKIKKNERSDKMDKTLQKKNLIKVIIIFLIILVSIIAIVITEKGGITNIVENRKKQMQKKEIESEIQNIIDITKQEIQESEGREATLADLKAKFEEQGYSLNEATGELRYNDYYVTINADLTIANIEEVLTKVQCQIININGDDYKTYITIENIDGIEKIIDSDLVIECEGKRKIVLDRTLKDGPIHPIKVKAVGKEEELYSIIVEKVPDIVVTNIDTLGNGTTKTVQIRYPKNENFLNYYSLDDGETWQEYEGDLNILEADNKTITAKTILQEEKIEGQIVKVKKERQQISLVVSTSLIDATKQAIMKNDTVYRVAIKDMEYKVHTYVEEGDLILQSSRSYGNANDVGTASENAKNMVILKVNGNLTINSGVTLTAYGNSYGGPKGMLVYVTEQLTNNGTITMTARGAKAPGETVYLWKNGNNNYEYVPAAGVAGGTGGTGKNPDLGQTGTTPSAANSRRTGGGGGGAGQGYYDSKGGNASAGTSYSGGCGGGGGSYAKAPSATGNGGQGGNANITDRTIYTIGAGGGAGNPGGLGKRGSSAANNNPGGNGTGGLLTIYANVFQNNSTISANGSAGGSAYRAGGGGSGGGSVNIFYKTNNKTGTITATGGAGGKGTRNGESANGAAGGNGSVTTKGI